MRFFGDGADVPGSGTPEANREGERLESLRTFCYLLWPVLRLYLRYSDVWGRKDRLNSGVSAALSARPRGTQGRVGSNTTHLAEFAGCLRREN